MIHQRRSCRGRSAICAADERRLDIGLTDAGRALKQRAAAVPPAMGECVGLDLEEAVQLSTLLRKVLANVRAS